MNKKEVLKEIDFNITLSELEKENLSYWNKNKIWEKSVHRESSQSSFTINSGPLLFTSIPTYGNLMRHLISDVVSKYQTMNGRTVVQHTNWSGHGSGLEFGVQKELNLAGNEDVEKYGIDNFNKACKANVSKYMQKWKKVSTMIGNGSHIDNQNEISDVPHIESVWWIFKQLFEKGLIYEEKKIVPFSTSLCSPLSDFEAKSNYKQVEDPAITLRIEIENSDEKFLVCTTTPWTLPSNTGLAVGLDIEYVKIKSNNEILIIAKDCLQLIDEKYEVIKEIKGEELLGIKYKPIFPYFTRTFGEGSFYVVESNHVSAKEGSGIVHIAPGYGEDDYKVGLNHKLGIIDPINNEGKFTKEIPELEGLNFRAANKKIIELLKQGGLLYKQKTVLRSLPHCPQGNTPLMYKVIPAWYIRVSELKADIIANNQKINWSPLHLKDGRFGQWLKDSGDLVISRNRFWGSPIPLWRCKTTGETICIESKKELELLCGQKIDDLHRDIVDKLVLQKAGKTFHRIPEILISGFEPGNMPVAQNHNFQENENKEFAANFAAENNDQVRGWFYTALTISTALFNDSPFKTAMVHGEILAEDGNKMSKNLRNYPDPEDLIERVGADALRFYLLNSKSVKGEEIRFSEAQVDQAVKQILLPLWNIFKFFITLANAENWQPQEKLKEEIKYNLAAPAENLMDKWILTCLQEFQRNTTKAYEENDLFQVTQNISAFIENLSHWYIRVCRRRFSKSENEHDKDNAYGTLYQVLIRFSQLAAPIMPHISETLYRTLTLEESIHLSEWPSESENQHCGEKIAEMEEIRNVVEAVLSLRNKAGIRIRQPLSKLYIGQIQGIKNLNIYQEILMAELNVKSINILEQSNSEVFDVVISLDFKALGPKLGKEVQKVKCAIQEKKYIFDGQTLVVEGIRIDKPDYKCSHAPKNNFLVSNVDNKLVALNINISDDLKAEGAVRDLIRHIQQMRKEADFKFTEKTDLAIQGAEMLISNFRNLIMTEVLAETLQENLEHPDITKEVDILSAKVNIALKRALK